MAKSGQRYTKAGCVLFLIRVYILVLPECGRIDEKFGRVYGTMIARRLSLQIWTILLRHSLVLRGRLDDSRPKLRCLGGPTAISELPRVRHTFPAPRSLQVYRY